MAIGYQEATVADVVQEELLKYTQGAVRLPAVLDVDTRDAGGSTTLLPGLVLAKYTAGAKINKYTHFLAAGSNGQGDEENGALLWNRIDNIDDGDQPATILVAGYVNANMVHFNTPANAAAYDWSANDIKLV